MLNKEINIESGKIPYEVFENPNLLKLSIQLDEFDLGNYETLEPNYLIRLKKLVKLDLTGILVCQNILRNEICKLTHLEELTLMYSGITTIPDEIKNLINLKKLVLRCNQIASLPLSFTKLANLEELNLIDNKFKEISTFLLEMKQLKVLCLRGNPLDLKYQNLTDSLGYVILEK